MFPISPLQKLRHAFRPKLPLGLTEISKLRAVASKNSPLQVKELDPWFSKTKDLPLLSIESKEDERIKLPLKVGVVLSGGQAPGGHNVICGLYDALKAFHSECHLFGFLNGPSGILKKEAIELTAQFLQPFRNSGGFDMIGSGRTKIETPEQFAQAAAVAKELKLNGLVIIGGDDSNTNAALLAEYFLKEGMETSVIGVPKTIDGDLKNEEIEISFGFDTATKTYSEIIGNILRDSLSAKKYYFFIKLMGRSASHIALECALQTHPNMTLIGEEVFQKKKTLKSLTNEIADMICKRADAGKNYGVILIPEGIIEFIPEFNELIGELNRSGPDHSLKDYDKISSVEKSLTDASKRAFQAMPKEIQRQLLLDRDPHGNVQVSKIETERLFLEAVKEELYNRKEKGKYSGTFSAQPLFFGYEGRSGFPSNFDCQYCYALGAVAATLINSRKTGYMSAIQNLSRPVGEWKASGIPLVGMIHLEERKGKIKPVIKKALVDLEGIPFSTFKESRENWMFEDDFRYPGPIQFEGPEELTDAITLTLKLEREALSEGLALKQ